MKKIFLGIIFLVGVFLRFYNISWGSPYFFHPDERNIANAIAGLHFPNQLNPHFFAYGSFPIYSIYLLSLLIQTITKTSLFENAIIASRIFSFLFSSLIPLSLFTVGSRLMNKKTGFIGFLLSLFSVGFIQYAHFGTFEMWITFLSLWFFFFSFQYANNKGKKNLFLSTCIFGLLIATKVSNLVLILLPFVFSIYPKTGIKQIGRILFISAFILLCGSLIFLILNPFSLLSFSEFKSSMSYESSVALGTLPVFYTQSFLKTVPIIFQLTSVFPFLLNPFIEIFFVISFFFSFYRGVLKKSKIVFALLATFLLIFLSQAFYLVKWTRYMVPTVPFIILLVSFSLSEYQRFFPKKGTTIVAFLIIASAFYSFCFFKTTYLQPDSRIEAAQWADKHLYHNGRILSEVYDLGIIPFNQYFPHISLFNFYDYDGPNGMDKATFNRELKAYDEIIIPSQRLVNSRLNNTEDFPKGHLFYKALVDGSAGFSQVYQTPCDFFCKFLFASNKLFPLEETTSVFDRPTVLIFQNETF